MIRTFLLALRLLYHAFPAICLQIFYDLTCEFKVFVLVTVGNDIKFIHPSILPSPVISRADRALPAPPPPVILPVRIRRSCLPVFS